VVGLIASPPLSRGDDKKSSNKEKIVGTWELVKSDDKDAPPPGTLAEFTRDGKLIITVIVEDKKIPVKGTYSVQGDTLKSAMPGQDGKEVTDTDTIKKLTDKELVLKDSKGKTTEWKKK
jgi:uncharacterized protein (TIGR03066 family)